MKSSKRHVVLVSLIFLLKGLNSAFNQMTPGAFVKNAVFVDILVVFRLDFGQISFNL